QGVREDIQAAFEPLCVTSGIPKELTDSFLEEVVKEEELIQPILQMYTEETLSLPTVAWKEDFSKRVEEYALTLRSENILEMTDEEFETLKASFPETADYFISEIASSIRLSGLFSVLGSAFGMVDRLMPYVALASIVFALFSGILLILIWKKKMLGFAYIGFVSAGILFLAPALLFRAGNYVARLNVEPSYFKQLFCSLSDGFIENVLVAGIAFCTIGILFGILALLFSKNKTNQKKI
ncbi:MAG: hypothetical protein IJC26_08605, partial [Clostridia bacterium]|nr:hypothetical protein [Clostridia bacterium]